MEIIRHVKDIFHEESTGEVINTGYKSIDDAILGLRKKEVSLFASMPGVGKTSMLLNLTLRMAKNRVPVLFITYETTAKKIAEKLLGLIANIDPFLIEKGNISGDIKNAIDTARKALSELPIYVSEQFMFTEDVLAREVENIEKQKIDVVFIDSLQFVQHSKHSDAEEREIENIMFLKNFARAHNLSLGVSTQIRSHNVPQGKMPTITDIGGEEEPADMVFILTRPYAYSMDQYVGEIEEFVVQVAKNRNGPSGTFKFSFSRRTLRISERDTQTF